MNDDDMTLTDRAYGSLREDILNGVLAPGVRLRLDPLKARYGMGASPLREALSRLAGDGFVIAEGRRGFSVPPVSLSELHDVTESRVMIETLALRCSLEQSARTDPHGWEAGIVASFYRLSKLDDQLTAHQPTAEWELRHADFHEALIRACPLQRILHFRQILFEQSERYRRLSLSQLPLDRDVPGEHRALMEAVLERQADRACELLAAHIRRTGHIVAEAVRGMNGRGALVG